MSKPEIDAHAEVEQMAQYYLVYDENLKNEADDVEISMDEMDEIDAIQQMIADSPNGVPIMYTYI
jgi:hypothetical protein